MFEALTADATSAVNCLVVLVKAVFVLEPLAARVALVDVLFPWVFLFNVVVEVAFVRKEVFAEIAHKNTLFALTRLC